MPFDASLPGFAIAELLQRRVRCAPGGSCEPAEAAPDMRSVPTPRHRRCSGAGATCMASGFGLGIVCTAITAVVAHASAAPARERLTAVAAGVLAGDESSMSTSRWRGSGAAGGGGIRQLAAVDLLHNVAATGNPVTLVAGQSSIVVQGIIVVSVLVIVASIVACWHFRADILSLCHEYEAVREVDDAASGGDGMTPLDQ